MCDGTLSMLRILAGNIRVHGRVLGCMPSTSITSISGGQLLSAGTSQNAGQIPLPPGIGSPFPSEDKARDR
jgi:hypothetical protein